MFLLNIFSCNHAQTAITANAILKDKCKKINKTPDTVAQEGLKVLCVLLLEPVLMFGGQVKMLRIKAKFETLK